MQPYGWGKYQFLLTHPHCRIGLTDKLGIPTIRVQPDAKFLHGVGARAAAHTIAGLLEGECGPVRLIVSRVDLFVDVQGWELNGDLRRNFVTRAKTLQTFEEGETFTGLQFGKRSTGTASVRIYDKTRDILRTRADYWKDIWGDAYNPAKAVLRVEAEMNRALLRQFRLTTPDEVLDAVGSLWSYCTEKWLTYRVPTSDAKRSRWPEAPEWEFIRHATLGEDSLGLSRVYKGQQRGEILATLPQMVRILAHLGALSDCATQAELLEVLDDYLNRLRERTGQSIEQRIRQTRKELELA